MATGLLFKGRLPAYAMPHLSKPASFCGNTLAEQASRQSSLQLDDMRHCIARFKPFDSQLWLLCILVVPPSNTVVHPEPPRVSILDLGWDKISMDMA